MTGIASERVTGIKSESLTTFIGISKSWLDRCLVPILVRQYLEEAKATVAVASEDVRDSACEMMTLPDEVKK